MSNLVLDALEIKNFRAFKHLQIEKLGRVNLIVGKNNVGKSSVLEALWLYAFGANPATVWSILSSRDETGIGLATVPKTEKDRVDAVKSLFHGRHDLKMSSGNIEIGPYKPQFQHDTFFMHVAEPMAGSTDELPNTDGPHSFFDEPEMYLDTDFVLVAKYGEQSVYYYPLSPDEPRIKRSKTEHQNIKCIHVPASGLTAVRTSTLWDAITLTPLENDVLFAVSLLDADIERIGMVGSNDSFTRRYAIVKVRQSSSPFPFRSMGEGMNRMFGISLALVNAKDGMLLIDEVDTGLHYSVLSDLWKLIFEVAHRLNVQVFATSHSWDCIQAFQQAAVDNEKEEGVLIRLENRNAGVGAVTFDERELAIVTREQIEVR